jgi:hypothetical protein
MSEEYAFLKKNLIAPPHPSDDFSGQQAAEKKYLTKILTDVLLPANEKYKHVTINWEETTVGKLHLKNRCFYRK